MFFFQPKKRKYNKKHKLSPSWVKTTFNRSYYKLKRIIDEAPQIELYIDIPNGRNSKLWRRWFEQNDIYSKTKWKAICIPSIFLKEMNKLKIDKYDKYEFQFPSTLEFRGHPYRPWVLKPLVRSFWKQKKIKKPKLQKIWALKKFDYSTTIEITNMEQIRENIMLARWTYATLWVRKLEKKKKYLKKKEKIEFMYNYWIETIKEEKEDEWIAQYTYPTAWERIIIDKKIHLTVNQIIELKYNDWLEKIKIIKNIKNNSWIDIKVIHQILNEEENIIKPENEGKSNFNKIIKKNYDFTKLIKQLTKRRLNNFYKKIIYKSFHNRKRKNRSIYNHIEAWDAEIKWFFMEKEECESLEFVRFLADHRIKKIKSLKVSLETKPNISNINEKKIVIPEYEKKKIGVNPKLLNITNRHTQKLNKNFDEKYFNVKRSIYKLQKIWPDDGSFEILSYYFEKIVNRGLFGGEIRREHWWTWPIWRHCHDKTKQMLNKKNFNIIYWHFFIKYEMFKQVRKRNKKFGDYKAEIIIRFPYISPLYIKKRQKILFPWWYWPEVVKELRTMRSAKFWTGYQITIKNWEWTVNNNVEIIALYPFVPIKQTNYIKSIKKKKIIKNIFFNWNRYNFSKIKKSSNTSKIYFKQKNKLNFVNSVKKNWIKKELNIYSYKKNFYKKINKRDLCHFNNYYKLFKNNIYNEHNKSTQNNKTEYKNLYWKRIICIFKKKINNEKKLSYNENEYTASIVFWTKKIVTTNKFVFYLKKKKNFQQVNFNYSYDHDIDINVEGTSLTFIHHVSPFKVVNQMIFRIFNIFKYVYSKGIMHFTNSKDEEDIL